MNTFLSEPPSLDWAEAGELLPCPFCGAQPVLNIIEPHKHHMHLLGGLPMPDYSGGTVIECGCGVGIIDDTSPDHRARVIDRWNRRAPILPPVVKG